jgi:hypothetical protein
MEKVKEKSITINPYLLKRLGINRNRCHLRIDVYNLSCVPYRFTPDSCTVLLILSPREQALIKKERSPNITFHIEVAHQDYDRPIPLFFRARIETFKELNNSQCLLKLNFLSIPKDYEELMNTYFTLNEWVKEKYNLLKEKDLRYNNDDLEKASLPRYINMIRETGEKTPLRIIDFSVNTINGAVDINENELNDRSEFMIEIPLEDISIPISTTQQGFRPSKEIPGVFIVQFNLECSLPYIDLISNLL